jgi:hypothetical protein
VIDAGGAIVTEIAGTIVMLALPVAEGLPEHCEEPGVWLQKIEVAVTEMGLAAGIAPGAV